MNISIRHHIPALALGLLAALGLSACDNQANDKSTAQTTVKLGVIAGPETELMEAAQKVAKDKFGLNVKLVTFADYTLPNAALNAGDLDANAFQHIPYLEESIKARGFKIVSIGKTFIYPMGVFSQKIKSLDELKEGDTIAIPNDPSNEGRALLVLQQAGLIHLDPNSGITATPKDIVGNPKKLEFKELDAAQLPRVLKNVTAAVINNTYAVPAGLVASKNAVFVEANDSPYANILVVRESEQKKPELLELLQAIQSPEVAQKAEVLFEGSAVPAWSTGAQ